MPDSDAQAIIRELTAWNPVPVNIAMIERAWVLETRYMISWWDALIVAAAQQSECAILLTEDLQHGQVFGDVRVVNPFESPERAPAQIIGAQDHDRQPADNMP